MRSPENQAPPGIEETEQNPDSRPEKQKEFEPTDEQVTKAWEVLGMTREELPGEDPKLEFIVSLSLGQKKFIDSIKSQTQGYQNAYLEKHPEDKEKKPQELPVTAGQKKLARIFTLRKLALGHDERAEETVRRSYGYLNERINKVAQKLQGLIEGPQSAEVQKQIARQRESLAWLSKHRKNMEALMAAGYPELWQKAKEQQREPRASSLPERPADELTPEDIEVLLREVGRNEQLEQTREPRRRAERPPEPEEPIETVEEKISPEEKTRRERLAKMIGPELGNNQEFAPEVVELLSEWGFNSVETVIKKREGKEEVEDVRTTIFIDPQSPHLQENLARVITESTFETGEKRFTAAFKELATDPKIPFRVKQAISQLTDNYRLRFPERKDAVAVLKFLNARDERPFAMYTQKSEGDQWNLASIEATSKRLIYRHQDEGSVPDYKDNVTVFLASPALTIETKASEL